jgi:hypothetical protein
MVGEAMEHFYAGNLLSGSKKVKWDDSDVVGDLVCSGMKKPRCDRGQLRIEDGESRIVNDSNCTGDTSPKYEHSGALATIERF